MKVTFESKDFTTFESSLRSEAKFGEAIGKVAKQIANSLYKILWKHTPVDFGLLRSKWSSLENVAYTVEKDGDGYSVTLYNRAEYAVWVNDGHRQQPGRFIPGKWIGNHFRYDPKAKGGMVLKNSWVKGRFFVEKSIVELGGSSELNTFLCEELQKWWEGFW